MTTKSPFWKLSCSAINKKMVKLCVKIDFKRPKTCYICAKSKTCGFEE